MELALKMVLYRYSTRERLTYPTKVPSLSDKHVEKTNAEVKRAQEEDTSGRGKYNEYTPEEHRLESSPLNMGPQRQSDISQSFCSGKFSFLNTAQPPYSHYRHLVRTGGAFELHVYVPRNLGICAILELRSAFSESL